MKISDYNVVARVDELLISQYKHSTNLNKYIKAFVSPLQTTFQALQDVVDSLNIDTATGDALDKIATIVGEERIVRGAAALNYFGFLEEAAAEPFNVGIFFSYGDPETGDLVLSDSQLRSLIRARILKNTRGGLINDVIEYVELLVGREVDVVVTEEPAHVNIRINDSLNVAEKLMLDIRMYGILPAGASCTLRDNNGVIEVTLP